MEFKFVESTTTFECASKDGNRCVTGKQASDDGDKLFLTCRPLLLSPVGTGSTVNGCFESFIARCDEYIEQVQRYKEEAQKYLSDRKDKSADDFLKETYHNA